MSKPTLYELASLVKEMRHWQRTFWSYKYSCVQKTAALNKSLALERRVDSLLAALESTQTALEVGDD